MTAVGYVRRSVQDAGGQVSREEQQAVLGQLAERYGETLGEVYTDWGRSGGDSHDESDALAHRPAFRSLLRAVEDGRVSAVFAHRVDRFGRSSHALGRLWAACKATGTRVITSEGDFSDDDDPATFLMRHTFEGFAVYYLKEQTAKNRRAMAYCRKRGDYLGAVPFGYAKRTPKLHGTDRVEKVEADPDGIAAVLAAYRETGRNYRQAARLLNEAGKVKPARTDKWYATSVAGVVQRHAPEEAKKAAERRARQTVPRLFRGLLRCACGSTMTPANSPRSLSYVCPQGHHDARHPRPVVISERKLLPWIREEAARLVDRDEYYREAGEYDDPATRAAIEALRAAGRDAMADELQAEYDRARQAQGEREQQALDVPDSIDWERWDVESVNRALRSLWEYVELGTDLMPIRAEWRMPERRRPD